MLDKHTYRLVGVFTNQGSRYRALNFIKSLVNPMFVIGKLTPWNDEDIPPTPSPAMLQIPEPYVYVRPTLIDILDYDYCSQDSSYLDQYKDYHPSLFPTRTEEVGKVLIASHISQGLIVSPFRVVGLVSNVELVPNTPYLSSYLPVSILDVGILHWVNYLSPTSLLEGGPHTLSIVINC
jgi:hypothetical protein